MTLHTAFPRLALVATVALCAAAETAGAQLAPPARARVPVTIAIVDQLPVPGAPFVVQRRPGVAPHDVILLREGATGIDLTAAIRTLQTARQAGGDFPAREGVVRTRPKGRNAPTIRELPWAARVMSDLRRANRREVTGVGVVRAVEIWLPSQQRGRRS